MKRPVPATTDPDTAGYFAATRAWLSWRVVPLRRGAASGCTCRGGRPRDAAKVTSNGRQSRRDPEASTRGPRSLTRSIRRSPFLTRSCWLTSMTYPMLGWSRAARRDTTAVPRNGDASRVRRPRRRDTVAELGAGNVTADLPFADGSVSLGIYPAGSTAAQMAASVVDQAVAAERCGYAGATVSEHHAGFPDYLPSPLQACGWILKRSRQHLGCARTDDPAAAKPSRPRRGGRVDRCSTCRTVRSSGDGNWPCRFRSDRYPPRRLRDELLGAVGPAGRGIVAERSAPR